MSKLKTNKKIKKLKKQVKEEVDVKKIIFLLFLGFVIGFGGVYLIMTKFIYKKPVFLTNNPEPISYNLSDIKKYLNYKVQFYYEPLDLVEYLKKPNGKILLVDIRDKQSFEKEHLKTAVLFKSIDQIKKLSENGKKEVILYGNYPQENRVYQVVMDLINKGLKVKVLSVGYNQFRHLKIYWLPQSLWDKIMIEDLVENEN